jgi:hypothetical protein
MPEPTEQPATKSSRRSLGGRRAFLGLILLALTSLLWHRSYHHGDVMAVFGPSGKIGGVLSYRGQLLIAFTNIDMGAERAWTIQTLASAPEEAADLHAMLYGESTSNAGVSTMYNPIAPPAPTATLPVISQKGPFMAGRHEKNAFGIQNKWCSLVGFPHWLLLPLGFWPIATWTKRKAQLRRRKKQNRCLSCGYDLRGAESRCPECGTGIEG